MAATDQRRGEVLRAIVTDYVATGEPVGSKLLVDRHNLGVSPATVRNDMSVLEEMGYLCQPHTSAGRVPTEKGYRAFVDQISNLRPLSLQQRKAIETFLLQAVDIDDVVERTVRALAQLTRQFAVVQYPVRGKSSLQHLELVKVGLTRLLLVIITDNGEVQQRFIETTTQLEDSQLAQLKILFNANLEGKGIEKIVLLSDFLPLQLDTDLRELVKQIFAQIIEVLGAQKSERIVMAGAGNLARRGTEFSNSIGEILDELEEQVILLRLFSQLDQDGKSVAVSIGSETGSACLEETSIITGVSGDKSGNLSHVGVVGPTRMDYPATMSAVRAVSKYLAHFLDNA